MQINAVCPSCKSRYQLNSELVGQKIRCPNSACREVFVVAEADEKPRTAKPKAPAKDRRAPSFEDSPTEQISEASLPAAPSVPKTADWSAMPPPPVRRPNEPAPAPAPASTGADEVLAWMMAGPAPAAEEAPPPVEDDFTIPDEMLGEAAPEDTGPSYDYSSYAPPPKRTWTRWAIIGLVIIGAAGTVGFLVYNRGRRARVEREMTQQGTTALEARQFTQAAKIFDDLQKNYPKSPNVPKYKFLKDYCQATDAATAIGPADKRREAFSQFIQKMKDDNNAKPMLEERQRAVWETLVRITDDQVNEAESRVRERKFDEAEAAMAEIEKAKGLLRTNAPNDEKNPIPDATVARIDKVTQFIDEERRYAEFLKHADKLLTPLTPAGLAQLEVDAKEKEYSNKAEVIKRIDDARQKLRERIVFITEPRPSERTAPASGLTSLLIGAAGKPASPGEKVVFAVARGILYALAEADGRVLWATRVGIDTDTLPLRLPGIRDRVPETVLVPTADGLGLIARDVGTGQPRWFQRLPAPIRGRPMLMKRRLYVPLTDDKGTVVLLEPGDGQQLGRVELGQRLGPGGAAAESASLIFLPADGKNVFVLDVNPPADPDGQIRPVSLQAVLATGHGTGTLRSEPVVVMLSDELVGGRDAAGVGYLILTRSDGVGRMRLSAYAFRAPITVLGEPVDVALDGWSWFAPICDQEKLALVTDTGTFAILGVNQKGNSDPALFPMLITSPGGGTPALGRGQIVYMEEQAFWYLANGELNMSRIGIDRRVGMKRAPGWPEAKKIGTSLHAAQVSANRDVLFAVTQTTSPPAWLATAVETQTGNVRWQRPLGLAPQGDPIRLGEFIYQLDQGAGLYQIDPKQITVPADAEWVQGGQEILKPRTDVAGTPAMLLAPDGQSAYIVFATGDGRQIHTRQIQPGQAVKELTPANLPAPMAGPPLLASGALVFPLKNGTLFRLKLGAKDGDVGPDWRAPGLPDTARSFVIGLNGDDLLATDGGRGVSAYRWPAGQPYQLKYQQKVADRIVSAPLAILNKDTPPRLLIAEAGGRVTLLDGEPAMAQASWELGRQLRQGNEITDGPYRLDGDPANPQVVVILDRTQMVCLDPDQNQPRWSFKAKGSGLAGRPRKHGTALLVTDLSGRYDAIDSATGRSLGTGFPATGVLPAAPAAAPVDMGAGRLFAPLADGAVLLLPVDALTGMK